MGSITRGRLLWTPYPWKAGFCITDDTDAADMESVRIVYDLLRDLNLPTTKTVWPLLPVEPSGIPPTPPSTLEGITLEDPVYRAYCQELGRSGFEIALHGASAGNNVRSRTIEAFSILQNEFGDGGTFICHSKNAENIYWEENCTSNPAERMLLRLFSRHKAFGEDEGSPYFWGDISLEKVSQIRLFRTRSTNTLSVNPSMPYYDEAKPYVRSWFSATKRSFHDCTTPEALDRLVTENGLTVLYQYMHRYARKEERKVAEIFQQDAERLANDSRVLVAPTSRMMERLRHIQGLFVGHRGDHLYLINTNSLPLDDVQIELPSSITLHRSEATDAVNVHSEPGLVRVESIPAEGTIVLPLSSPITISSRRSFRFDSSGRGEHDVGHGTFRATLTKENERVRWELLFPSGLEGLRPMSRIDEGERRRLFYAQAGIILRELIRGNRHLNYQKFLGNAVRPLEDHQNW